MATKKEATGEEGKKSGKKWIILILLVVLLAGGAGGGYWWKFMRQSDESTEGGNVVKKKKKEEAPVFVAFDVFTVNLQGEDNPLLQVAITVQMADEEDASKLKQYLPIVRSRLITLLTSKRASELLTPEGKNDLAKAIADEIGQPFFQGDYPLQIRNVLFTSFIVQ